jgi:hypothetical protein
VSLQQKTCIQPMTAHKLVTNHFHTLPPSSVYGPDLFRPTHRTHVHRFHLLVSTFTTTILRTRCHQCSPRINSRTPATIRNTAPTHARTAITRSRIARQIHGDTDRRIPVASSRHARPTTKSAIAPTIRRGFNSCHTPRLRSSTLAALRSR